MFRVAGAGIAFWEQKPLPESRAEMGPPAHGGGWYSHERQITRNGPVDRGPTAAARVAAAPRKKATTWSVTEAVHRHVHSHFCNSARPGPATTRSPPGSGGTHVKKGQYDQYADHCRLLRTIEDVYVLLHLAGAR